jgi:hypothetical protein
MDWSPGTFEQAPHFEEVPPLGRLFRWKLHEVTSHSEGSVTIRKRQVEVTTPSQQQPTTTDHQVRFAAIATTTHPCSATMRQ